MKTLRQSILGSYEVCPYSCKQEWGDIGEETSQRTDEGSGFYAHFGIFLHTIFEKVQNTDATIEELLQEYEDNVQPILLKAPLGKEAEFYMNGIEQITWVYEHYKTEPRDTLICEMGFDGLKIEGIDMECTGTMDTVDIRPDGIYLSDWKTGRHDKFTKKELSSNLQVFMYSMAIQNKYGQLPKEFTFIFPKFKRVKTVKITEDFMKTAYNRLMAIWGKMKDGQWEFTGTASDFFCHNFCDCKDTCPKHSNKRGAVKQVGWEVFKDNKGA